MGKPTDKTYKINIGDGQVAEVTDGGYVDLDAEPTTLADGTVLDEAGAEKWVAEILERTKGRPSLSGRPGPSRRVNVRLGSELDARLRQRVAADHSSESEVIRAALDAWLDEIDTGHAETLEQLADR